MAGFLSNVNMLEPYQKVQAIKTNEIQQAVDTMKLEEMREEKKKQDTPIPFDMFLGRLSDMHGKSVADAMGEEMRKMGYVDEIPGVDNKQPIRSVKVGNIENFNKYLNQYPENSAKFIGIELKSLEDREVELQKLREKTTKEEERNNIDQEIKDNQQKQITVLKNAENNQKKLEKKQQILKAKQTIMETETNPNVKGVLDNLKRQAESGDKDAGYILMQYMGARNSLLQGDITAKDFHEAQRHIIEKVVGKEAKPVIQSDKIQGVMAELGIDPNNPANYTPENIAKASARIRSLETQERRERGEDLTAVQRTNIAHQLRTELRQDKYVQDFKDVDNKFKVMESAHEKSKSGKEKSYVAIDQALITLYNKMTDPSSVVRESEYARTPENMSVVNRLLGKIDKWKQGGAGLTSDERKALVQMASEFHNRYSINYDQIVSDYEKTAKESGIDPNLIGIPYRRKNIPTQQQKQGRFKIREVK